MTAPSGLEIVDLEALGLEDFDIPCDYAEGWRVAPSHPHGPAAWIAKPVCPECGSQATRLICTPCRDLLMSTLDAVECRFCHTVVAPARKGFASFEPLDRKKVR